MSAASPLPDGERDSHAQWAPLVDVSDIQLSDLLADGDNSALGRSIRRLVRSLDDPNGVISAFSNFVQ